MTELDNRKIVEFIVDEDQKDVFFDQLMPKLGEKFEELYQEALRLQSRATTNVINELTTQISHLAGAVFMTNESIASLVKDSPEVNENQLEEIGVELSSCLVDKILHLLCEKYTVELPEAALLEKGSDLAGKV